MVKKRTDSLIPSDIITSKIYFIRDKKVMLDRDLAELYGVRTQVLNQAVKRKINRFPDDFMFSLSRAEIMDLSQLVISSAIKHAPNVNVFTEQGVAMLSGVLNSNRAIQVNIQIMRMFIRLREMHDNQKYIITRLNKHEIKLWKHDKQFADVIQTLDEMRKPKESLSKQRIGFIPSKEE
jgi:hypothetical protein